MQRVAGLVTSPTTSSVAIITRRTDGTCIANTTTITSRGRRDAGIAELTTRLVNLAEAIDHATASVLLAVVDTPTALVQGDRRSAPKQLWCFVVGRLRKRKVPTATRTQRSADPAGPDLAELWPDVDLSNPGEGTALDLAHLAAVRLGWDVPVLDRHFKALDAIRWPDTTSAVPGSSIRQAA